MRLPFDIFCNTPFGSKLDVDVFVDNKNIVISRKWHIFWTGRCCKIATCVPAPPKFSVSVLRGDSKGSINAKTKKQAVKILDIVDAYLRKNYFVSSVVSSTNELNNI